MYDFFSFLQSFCKGQPIYIVQYIAYNQTFFLFVNLTNNSDIYNSNSLSANPTKWSNTLKQFVGFFRRIVWVSSTILWGWHLKS